MAYPTGTPVDEAILDDLVSTLQGIATPAYHSTVVSVERFSPSDATRIYEFPCLLVGTPIITWSDAINPLLEGVIRLVIRGVVEDLETHQQSLSWLAADIRAALLADVSRSGLAVDTKIVQQEAYMLIAEAGDPVAAVDVTVQIRFRHLYSDPNTAQ